jgi:hypothetical protein
MASDNRKKIFSESLLICMIWFHNFQSEQPIKNDKIGSSEYKPEMIRVIEDFSESYRFIRGGDLGKSGPSPRAKADAKKPMKGNSIFVEGFIRQSPYSSSPGKSKPLSTRNHVKINSDEFNENDNHKNNDCKSGKNSNVKYPKGPFEETENERIFRECSIDPQRKIQTEQAIDETKAILTLKKHGVVTNISRPKNPAVNLDFEVTGLGDYEGVTHVDIKTPISFEDLESQGKAVSGPNTYSEVGRSMGKKLLKQKSRFCGLQDGPANRDQVLHVIDLKKLPNSDIKKEVMQATLNAVEETGNSTKLIYFINSD